jgi:O-antigen biosynthesis protein WbqP
MFYAHGGKRAVDLAIVLLALFVLFPILVLTVLLIVLDDGRPVLYLQDRIGKGMATFRIYKFRSMRKGTASMTSVAASSDAITRVGKVIRRTNIDELPQLLNILRGEMSIVGPRPALPSQEVLLSEREASGVVDLRPGLTGLAQVRAFDGMSEKEKADWDAQYAENVTLFNDIKIILQTVAYLFRKQPVY